MSGRNKDRRGGREQIEDNHSKFKMSERLSILLKTSSANFWKGEITEISPLAQNVIFLWFWGYCPVRKFRILDIPMGLFLTIWGIFL